MNRPSPNKTTLNLSGRTVEVTHLDKIFWPKEKITKGDLIDYYRSVAPYILPYLQNRPESLNRHPNGITGPNFFQKDVGHMPPRWVKTKKIYSESTRKYVNFLVGQNEAALVYMVNLGCIELNPWNSRVGHLNNPDYLIIDLDPEGVSFDKVVETAQVVHEVLEGQHIPNYCKTSGATGLHVYVPLGARYHYRQAAGFARVIAEAVHARLPKLTSMERHPAKRQRKVYLDYLQNSRGQTLACAYSVRPKPGATVSAPLAWTEVKRGLSPRDFTMKNILARIKTRGDLWQPVLGQGVNMEQALAGLK
jgi:bifunctional non-homologous end joining protein LigD